MNAPRDVYADEPTNMNNYQDARSYSKSEDEHQRLYSNSDDHLEGAAGEGG